MGKKEDGYLKKFVKAVEQRFKPDKIILFGSRARGDFLEDSDYDILIVADYFSKMLYPQRVTEALEELKDPLDVELICLTPEEFSKKSKQITIIAEAVREGKELLAKA